MQPGKAKSVRVLIDAALRGELTKAQARQLYKHGREAVTLALLVASKRIAEQIQPVVTEHIVYRDYCPQCKKHVEPVVPDALPNAMLGHQVISLTSWLHYGLGVTIDQIVDILSYHLQTNLTPGGLVEAWQRLAEVLAEWYEQIGTQAKQSTHLHADETGWRVNGQTHWLWCFANAQVCYYMIDRCKRLKRCQFSSRSSDRPRFLNR